MGQPIVMNPEQPVVKSYQELGTEQFGPQFSGDAVVAELNINLYKALGMDRAFQTEEDFISTYGNVQKAIATDDVSGFADATALRLENLDDVMTSVLYSNEHLVLWNWVNRVVSKQPTFEWNERRRYGGGRRSPGFTEGGTPRSATGQWERNTIQTKYLGVKRGITHQALTTGLLGGFQVSPTEEEERSGTLDLLGICERWLIHGDADIKAVGGGTVNYDGILQLLLDYQAAGRIDSRNIIDKAGQPLTFDDIEHATVTTFKLGKLASTANQALFLDPNVSSGLSMQKLPAERAVLATEGIPTGRYVSGVPLGGFKTGRGVVPFKESLFMDEVEYNDPILDASDTEPTAPASPTCTTAAATDTGATWSGTFYYWVASINDGGESVAVVDSDGAQAVTEGQKCTITIPHVTGAHGFRIYRGELDDGSDAKLIGHVAATGASVAFVDQNKKIPGTTDALLLYNAQDTMVIAQMAPLIKFPLGIVSTTIEFLLLLYHVLVLKAPERVVWWRNVGSYIST